MLTASSEVLIADPTMSTHEAHRTIIEKECKYFAMVVLDGVDVFLPRSTFIVHLPRRAASMLTI